MLSAALGTCNTDSSERVVPGSTAGKVPLTEYRGASLRPPGLTYGATQVVPYAVDWKHGDRTERRDRTGTLPSAFQVTGIVPSQFTLSDPRLPEHLQIAIFHGAAADIDPLALPDRSLVCKQSVEEACNTIVKDDSLLVSLPVDALPRKGNVIISIGAEYIAEPGLHSERFVNTVSWVLALDIQ